MTLEGLKADLLREHPEAIDAAVLQAAHDHLRAAMRFTRLMLESDDPFAGTRSLINATAMLKEATTQLQKDLAAQKAPKGTIEAFSK